MNVAEDKKLVSKTRKGAMWVGRLLFTAIFSYYCVPPLISILNNGGKGIWTAIIDTIAINSAKTNTMDVLSSIMGIFLGFFISGTYLFSEYAYKKLKEIEKVEKVIDRLEKEEITVSEARETVSVIKNMQKPMKYKWMVGTRVLKLSIIVCICFLVIVVFLFMITNLLPVTYRALFDNSIDRISPYIDSSEVDLLKSDWTRMKTYEDYTIIAEKINVIDTQFSLR